MPTTPWRLLWAGALVLAGAVVMLPHGHLQGPGTVPWFLAGAAVMAAGFLCALAGKSGRTVGDSPDAPFGPACVAWFWLVAVGARAVLLFQAPGDDIFRYVWEGRLVLGGWNPYVFAPDADVLADLRDDLWGRVQHRTFTAIYPPLAQWAMAVIAALAAKPFFFKLVFAAADLAVAALLVRRFGARPTLLYAWNPLVIYSFAGGGHYDSLFLLALTLGWLAWESGRGRTAIAWLGAAVALKWLALPLLGWALWRTARASWAARRPSGFLMAVVLAALPFLAAYVALGLRTGDWPLVLFPEKFTQYARSAEFLPGIVGHFREASRYQNIWLAAPLALAWTVITLRVRTPARAAEWYFFSALVLSPMVHAWYFTWLMPFAVATRNRGAIAVAVSGFVYFMLHIHIESPGGQWVLSPLESALLWLPFAVGFLLHMSHPMLQRLLALR